MKSWMKSKGFILLISLVFCFGLGIIFITCFGQQTDKGDTGGQDGPWPPESIFLALYSANGKYTMEANGFSSLDFEAKVTKNDGSGYPDLPVTFTTNVGYLTYTSSYTDSNGIARTTLYATCVPSEGWVLASCTGESDFKTVTLSGDPPQVIVKRSDHMMGAAGFNNKVTIVSSYMCAGIPLTDVQMGFWSERGCFHHGCDSFIYTNNQGEASQVWYPPMWGTDETSWSDYNAPQSVVIRSYYKDDPTYYDSTVVYIYPLHAILSIGAEEDYDTGHFNMHPLSQIPVVVKTYWIDENLNILPQRGITVTFTVDGGQSNSLLSNTSATTNYDGLAVTTLDGGGSPNLGNDYDITTHVLAAGIIETDEEYLPGDCCLDNVTPPGWEWADQKIIDVGGDMPCQSTLFVEAISINGDTYCDEFLIFVYDENGPVDAWISASFSMYSHKPENECGGYVSSPVETVDGYGFFKVCSCEDTTAVDWVNDPDIRNCTSLGQEDGMFHCDDESEFDPRQDYLFVTVSCPGGTTFRIMTVSWNQSKDESSTPVPTETPIETPTPTPTP
ncbi:Ig-like domain-containing protein [candidate division CSSED10-310 bacterium]|uniref:Ig-like domain-containing protein n=1 Tax=candidate division CSSED10-310 bacterium TaxID=2855610 RepID=A0ABV6Z2E8_UNCC1